MGYVFRFFNGAAELLTTTERSQITAWDKKPERRSRRIRVELVPGSGRAYGGGDGKIEVSTLELIAHVQAYNDGTTRALVAKLEGELLGAATSVRADDSKTGAVLGWRWLLGGGFSVLETYSERHGKGVPGAYNVTLVLQPVYPFWTLTQAESDAAYNAATKVGV